MNNLPKGMTFERLLEGEMQVSLINEPLEPEEPKRENATARALRRPWARNCSIY